MLKKAFAKEYLTFLRWFLRGLLIWAGFVFFMVLMFYEGSMGDFFEALFMPLGSAGSEGVLLGWAIILAPYIVLRIIHSIKWAKENAK